MSLTHIGDRYGNPRAKILADTLNNATTEYLLNNRSPSRKVNELDNRGSHFYLAMYWAQSLANQSEDPVLATRFRSVAASLTREEVQIVDELNAAQGRAMDLGGYYLPNEELVASAMRPSATFNRILGAL